MFYCEGICLLISVPVKAWERGKEVSRLHSLARVCLQANIGLFQRAVSINHSICRVLIFWTHEALERKLPSKLGIVSGLASSVISWISTEWLHSVGHILWVFLPSCVKFVSIIKCSIMHLKNPYTYKNEKSEYEISMLAGLIFHLHLHPCVLWGIDTETVLKSAATRFMGWE